MKSLGANSNIEVLAVQKPEPLRKEQEGEEADKNQTDADKKEDDKLWKHIEATTKPATWQESTSTRRAAEAIARYAEQIGITNEAAELGVGLQNWSAQASAFHKAKENPGKKSRSHGPQRGFFPELVLKKLKPPKAASGKDSAPGGCSFELFFLENLKGACK